MSLNSNPVAFNWQSTSPETGFLPLKANFTGSVPSGTLAGTMSSTNTIYTQIVSMQNYNGLSLSCKWTGTPTGTLSVMAGDGAEQGVAIFSALTFSPSLNQPAGSASTNQINLDKIKFRWIYLSYTNSSGSGTLTVLGTMKDR